MLLAALLLPGLALVTVVAVTWLLSRVTVARRARSRCTSP